MSRRRALVLAGVFAGVLNPDLALGHGFSRSRSLTSWGQDGRVDFEVNVPRAALSGRPAEEYAPARLRPEGSPCVVDKTPEARGVDRDRLSVRWTVRCAANAPRAIRSDLFVDDDPSHLHFATLLHGGERSEGVLTTAHRTLGLDAETPADPNPGGVLTMLVSGARHVLEGADHVCFVLGCLLLGGTLLQMVTVVSGFTVGHTLALGLVALGLTRVNEEAVEVLVAASVAFIGLHAFAVWGARRTALGLNAGLHVAMAVAGHVGGMAMPLPAVLSSLLLTSCLLALGDTDSRSLTRRTTLALLMGTVHGLAFASVVTSLLPRERPLVPLLAFNVGAEVGQLAIIAACLLLRFVAPRSRQSALAAPVLAAVVVGLGVAWTLRRLS